MTDGYHKGNIAGRTQNPLRLEPGSYKEAGLSLTVSEDTAEAFNRHLELGTGTYRLLTIRHGLRTEIRFPGMRMTSRGPKCSTICRRQLGLSGRPRKLLYQLEACLVVMGVLILDDITSDDELERKR